VNAQIITIGDEILIGQIIDTNSSWIAEQLNGIGIKVQQKISVGDDKNSIIEALNRSCGRTMVFITGGLGPTKDDITKSTLCEFFNTRLIFNEQIFKDVESFFIKRNLPMIESNVNQAYLPESCEVIRNFKGTAAGMWFKKDGTDFISMPGVPFEMKPMMEDSIIPLIKQRFALPVIVHRTILTHGIGESFLAKKIEKWEDNLPENIKLAYLPSPEHLRLRLSIYGTDEKFLTNTLDNQEQKLKEYIENEIFGFGKQTLEEVVGIILKSKGATISTAESCTGGKIAHLLTSVAGSSSYFKGSVIAYSNEVKTTVLNVNSKDIELHGAVSEEVVKQMALGVQKLMQTDYAIATSGIAGPEGGTEEKPVGTTWIAVAGKNKIWAKKFIFSNDRDINIRRASASALDSLRRILSGIDKI
jgi:nicotinamide-nucleotide amidase